MIVKYNKTHQYYHSYIIILENFENFKFSSIYHYFPSISEAF